MIFEPITDGETIYTAIALPVVPTDFEDVETHGFDTEGFIYGVFRNETTSLGHSPEEVAESLPGSPEWVSRGLQQLTRRGGSDVEKAAASLLVVAAGAAYDGRTTSALGILESVVERLKEVDVPETPIGLEEQIDTAAPIEEVFLEEMIDVLETSFVQTASGGFGFRTIEGEIGPTFSDREDVMDTDLSVSPDLDVEITTDGETYVLGEITLGLDPYHVVDELDSEGGLDG